MGKPENRKWSILPFFLILSAVWTLVIGISLGLDLSSNKRIARDMAYREANMSFQKDLVYRKWAALHGGVYVPVTIDTPPNPYLSHVRERDLVTPSGLHLTLMNPAYMTRQVHEMGKIQYGSRGHITSLKPIRPENAADSWEMRALNAFENGEIEVSGIEKIDGKSWLRLMRPLRTEKSCLTCHAVQGYREGEIRGGISVSVPMAEYRKIEIAGLQVTGRGHLIIWILGMIGLAFAYQGFRVQIRLRENAEREVREINSGLQNRVESEVEKNRKQETLLFQQSRLASMGEMVHNIAHQWRQPLNALGLLVQNVLSRDPDTMSEQYRAERCEKAMKLIDYMSGTIDDFRNFFKPDRAQECFDPSVAARRALSIVEASLTDHDIRLRTELASGIYVMGFPNEFAQVMLNLVNNSRDAILDRKSPEPEIAVRVIRENGQLIASVTDNAGGIAPEILPRVFEPFFTTKSSGTGIGLYMSRMIIENNMGGKIEASNVSGGVTFRLILPLHERE